MERYTYIHLSVDNNETIFEYFFNFYDAVSFGAKHSSENPGKSAQVYDADRHCIVASFKMIR